MFTWDLAAIPIPRLEAWKVRVIMNNLNDLNKQRCTTWLMANFEIRKDCQPVKENIRTWIPPIAAGTQHLDQRCGQLFFEMEDPTFSDTDHPNSIL